LAEVASVWRWLNLSFDEKWVYREGGGKALVVAVCVRSQLKSVRSFSIKYFPTRWERRFTMVCRDEVKGKKRVGMSPFGLMVKGRGRPP
jgi:hypothetical protein